MNRLPPFAPLVPLVTTADDVGLHREMTAGALEAHDRGIVTAVSVAANGEDFAGAVERLRERPGLDIGAHLVLVGERPLSPAREISSLVDSRGAFLPGFAAFCGRALRGGVRTEHVRLELGRQMERLADTGLPIVHVNSHQHLHALPQIRRVVIELAARFGVRFVRVPTVQMLAISVSPRALGLRGLSWLAPGVRRSARQAGLRTIERTVGIADAGHFHRQVLAAGLDAATPTELVVHPARADDELERRYGWGYAWQRETAELCAPELAEWLALKGFAPARFSDLP